MVPPTWEWDPTLYAGSAAHYARGRVPYPAELAAALAAELRLDGRGDLLDLGCGPGSLTLLLAGLFERVTGVDADPDMLAEGRRRAAAAGTGNIRWVRSRAEDLPASLGPFRLVTLAQSFHWMEQARVATLVHGLREPGGAVAHVHATTHQGVDGTDPLPHPRPPRREVDALVERFLGSRRRAGQGVRASMVDEEERGRREDALYRGAGFVDRTRLEVPGRVVTRTADQVVASIFSLSYAAPHLFGDRLADFERHLRAMLAEAAPDGVFSEQLREIAVDVWR